MKYWLCAVALSLLLGGCVVREEGYHRHDYVEVEPSVEIEAEPVVIDEVRVRGHYHHHH